MTTARERAVAALAVQEWRPDPYEPLARASAHVRHRYDYACALCRPDLRDGYGRIVDVTLTAALADLDGIAARIDPSIVEPQRSAVLAAWTAAEFDAAALMAEREAEARRRAADVVAFLHTPPTRSS